MSDDWSVEDLVRAHDRISSHRRLTETLRFLSAGRHTGVTAQLPGVIEPQAAATLREQIGVLDAAGASAILVEPVPAGAPPAALIEALATSQVPLGVLARGSEVVGRITTGLLLGCSYVQMGVLLDVAGERAEADQSLRSAVEGLELLGQMASIDARVPVLSVGGSFGIFAPSVALDAALLEARLTVEAGVRDVVVTYAPMGNILQDVAAIHVLRSECAALRSPGGADVQCSVAVASWPGSWPEHPGEAYSVLGIGALVAGLADVELGLVGGRRGGSVVPIDGIVEAAQAERQLLDMLDGQTLETSDALRNEEKSLRTTTQAIVSGVLELPGADLRERLVTAVDSGLLPILQDENGPKLVRSADGSIRWASAGRVPLPESVLARDREMVQGQATSGLSERLVPELARVG